LGRAPVLDIRFGPSGRWAVVQQRIKNELVGKEHEAVELYPAESRKVDSSNQYHLWVLVEKGLKFPFGYTTRDVLSPEALAADLGEQSPARQRPFEEKHEAPDR
jgi:hypothetical protein